MKNKTIRILPLQPMSIGKRQEGVTLVIALILLLVMSLLGLSAMKATTMEEKMVGNTQDLNVAFEAAEAALRAAADDIENAEDTGFTDGCVLGYCTAGGGGDTDARWEDAGLDVWSGSSQTVAGVAGVNSQPKYIIEKMSYTGAGSSPSLVVGYSAGSGGIENYYRVTARGTGASDTAVVMLQALYVR